jgi:hypothetical protein
VDYFPEQVRVSSYGETRPILDAGHYLGGTPRAAHRYVLDVDGDILAIAEYGQPGRELTAQAFWKPGTMPEASTIELLRFWVKDGLDPKLKSWFMAQTLTRLPTIFQMVISFCDPSPAGGNHTGTLYLTSGWIAVGKTKSREYEYRDADGKRVSKAVPWKRFKASCDGDRERALLEHGATNWSHGEALYAASRGWVRTEMEHKLRFARARTKYAKRNLRRDYT